MSRIVGWLRSASGTVGLLGALAGPWLELGIRLWLAQAFLALQVRSMLGGGALGGGALGGGALGAGALGAGALGGGAPGPGLMQAVAGSDLGMLVQAACPVLLALGLLARPAAVGLLLQVALMPGAASGDTALFWAALLLRVAVYGAGPLSVDRALHRGAESLAVPGVQAVQSAFGWATRVLGPVYALGLRLWLAVAPLGLALGAMGSRDVPGLPHVPSMVAGLAPGVAVVLAAMLALGLGARLAAFALALLVPFSALMLGDARLYWVLALGLVVVHGAGPFALDAWLGAWLGRRMAPVPGAGSPHVVVVGGGFGGIAAVRGLRHVACRVTLVDRRNHHLFQPLLYQVATAGLSPADIATPIRGMVRDQPNARVLLGEVSGVDVAGKAVLLGGSRIPYDTLVLATGARHGYFGRDDWAAFAPGLKSIEDATGIRRRLLLAFEEAESAATEAERAAWLTFVIVGGGPTGVELAGAIAELARHGMEQEFRSIEPSSARVLLVQSGPRLLPAFPEALSAEASRALRHLGVELQLDRKVEAVDAAGVMVSGEAIPARTVLWAAGVMASPAAAWLGVTADRAGRVPVEADLSVAGLPDVFVVGDTAASMAWAGEAVPGLAPAAKQGGAYVARVVGARLRGRRAPGPFRYRHLGSLATIGRQSAVADFGFVRVRGAVAWWLWGAAHILFLVGGRNRATVLVQWLWAYLTFSRGTRLITSER